MDRGEGRVGGDGAARPAEGAVPPRGRRRVDPLAPLRRTVLGERFPEHLLRSGLIEPGDVVVIAVSGGADSVALLHLLRFLLERWELRLVAAHFDHAMRSDSAADADWVAGLCKAWGVPLERERARHELRSEAEARTARYRFLHDVADRHAADRLVLAHHADDQAETVLFRAIRGTGLRGLAGIPERRGRIVRPLLPFRRADVKEYLLAARLSYRVDPSNLSGRYARNRLRNEVIPRLESIVPGASRSLARLAARARAEEAAWASVLETLERELVVGRSKSRIELALPLLLEYHAEVRARVLRRMLRRLGSVPDRAGTRSAVEFTTYGKSGAGIDLAGGVRLEREFDRLVIRRTAPVEAPSPDRSLVIETSDDGQGRVTIGGQEYAVRWGRAPVESNVEEAISLRPEAVRFPLEVRPWRPGDRIRLPYGTKKLKKVFGERRVRRTERARVPVLAEVDGRILWIVGVARSAVAESEPGHFRIEITRTDAELA